MSTDSRENFNKSWLTEMPMGTDARSTYAGIVTDINDRLSHGIERIQVSDNLYKIEGEYTAFYWYEESKHILLACCLERIPHGYVVSMVGKDPTLIRTSPYTSDLYSAILADKHHSIRLMSDRYLTDEGLAIWKRLFASGHHISVYDANSPGNSFVILNSEEEMLEFFKKHDPEYRRFQYVLSESIHDLVEVKTVFNIRRMRELSGDI